MSGRKKKIQFADEMDLEESHVALSSTSVCRKRRSTEPDSIRAAAVSYSAFPSSPLGLAAESNLQLSERHLQSFSFAIEECRALFERVTAASNEIIDGTLKSQLREIVNYHENLLLTEIKDRGVLFCGDNGVGKSYVINNLLMMTSPNEYPAPPSDKLEADEYLELKGYNPPKAVTRSEELGDAKTDFQTILNLLKGHCKSSEGGDIRNLPQYLLPSMSTGVTTTPVLVSVRYGHRFQAIFEYVTEETAKGIAIEWIDLLRNVLDSDDDQIDKKAAELGADEFAAQKQRCELLLCKEMSDAVKICDHQITRRKYDEARRVALPANVNEIVLHENLKPRLGRVEVFAGDGLDMQQDRVYIRCKILEKLMCGTSGGSEEKTRNSAILKDVQLFAPSGILNAVNRITDSPGLGSDDEMQNRLVYDALRSHNSVFVIAKNRDIGASRKILEPIFAPDFLKHLSTTTSSLCFVHYDEKGLEERPEIIKKEVQRKMDDQAVLGKISCINPLPMLFSSLLFDSDFSPESKTRDELLDFTQGYEFLGSLEHIPLIQDKVKSISKSLEGILRGGLRREYSVPSSQLAEEDVRRLEALLGTTFDVKKRKSEDYVNVEEELNVGTLKKAKDAVKQCLVEKYTELTGIESTTLASLRLKSSDLRRSLRGLEEKQVRAAFYTHQKGRNLKLNLKSKLSAALKDALEDFTKIFLDHLKSRVDAFIEECVAAVAEKTKSVFRNRFEGSPLNSRLCGAVDELAKETEDFLRSQNFGEMCYSAGNHITRNSILSKHHDSAVSKAVEKLVRCGHDWIEKQPSTGRKGGNSLALLIDQQFEKEGWLKEACGAYYSSLKTSLNASLNSQYDLLISRLSAGRNSKKFLRICFSELGKHTIERVFDQSGAPTDGDGFVSTVGLRIEHRRIDFGALQRLEAEIQKYNVGHRTTKQAGKEIADDIQRMLGEREMRTEVTDPARPPEETRVQPLRHFRRPPVVHPRTFIERIRMGVKTLIECYQQSPFARLDELELKPNWRLVDDAAFTDADSLFASIDYLRCHQPTPRGISDLRARTGALLAKGSKTRARLEGLIRETEMDIAEHQNRLSRGDSPLGVHIIYLAQAVGYDITIWVRRDGGNGYDCIRAPATADNPTRQTWNVVIVQPLNSETRLRFAALDYAPEDPPPLPSHWLQSGLVIIVPDFDSFLNFGTDSWGQCLAGTHAALRVPKVVMEQLGKQCGSAGAAQVRCNALSMKINDWQRSHPHCISLQAASEDNAFKKKSDGMRLLNGVIQITRSGGRVVLVSDRIQSRGSNIFNCTLEGLKTLDPTQAGFCERVEETRRRLAEAEQGLSQESVKKRSKKQDK